MSNEEYCVSRRKDSKPARKKMIPDFKMCIFDFYPVTFFFLITDPAPDQILLYKGKKRTLCVEM